MQIAAVLFDRLTALDIIGPYEVLQRLPDAVVTFVDHAGVAEFLVGIAARSRSPITVNQMAVQVEGDAVGPDHDPVVGAVDEVLVERGVGGDRVAALRLPFAVRSGPCPGVS